MVKPVYSACVLGAAFFCLVSFTGKFGRLLNDGPSPARTPTEELATFQLEPGLKMQLVAAEPMVQDPVVITFDEDGRL